MRYFIQKIVVKNIFNKGHSKSFPQFQSLFISSTNLLMNKQNG